jgi:hypothetical protein
MTRVVAGLVAAFSIAVVMFNLIHIGDFGFFAFVPISLSPFALVGALLIVRVPRNAVGWLLIGSGVCFAIAFAGGEYATAAMVFDPGSLPAGEVAAGLSQACVVPAIGLTVLLLLLFPAGRGLGGRWTLVERAVIAFVVFITLVDLFKNVPVPVGPQTSDVPQMEIANPFALPGPVGQAVTSLAALVDTTTLPTVLLGPLSLFVRYRRASPTEREQIKWLAYSGTLALVLLVLSNFVPGDLGNLIWPVALVVLGTLPVAIAVAIFRYRLNDIDVLIRRTLVYAAVSAVLLATYVGGVALFESLLAPFTAGNGIAVAISTLAVVALFQPVRRRIQSAVDHRFFRAKYDAQSTLDAFAARLRDEVDLDAVRGDLIDAVQRTVQPAHASVWLREAGR